MTSTIIDTNIVFAGKTTCACGNEMHVSMRICGDCIEDSEYIERVVVKSFISTRRNFQYGN